MKRKIFLHYLILTIIGVSITGFFTSELAQKFYKYEVEQKLKSIATLIQTQISDEVSKGIKVDYDKSAKKYATILKQVPEEQSDTNINTRVTFIDFKGNVLGESETQYQTMENHLHRKEVLEAVNGKVGEDIRFSKTLKIDFLYIAVPIEPYQIIVRVSVPLVQLKKINELLWYYTIIGILIGLAFTTLLALRFSTSITNPIRQLMLVSKEISAGNYSKRVNIRSKDELGQLAETFNEMTLTLEKSVAELVDKNMKVDSIINSMINGIVAVDNKCRIILINAIACETFNIKNTPDIIGANIIEVIRNNQINNLLQKTIENNASLVNEITLGSLEGKILRIYTSPIKSEGSTGFNSGGILFIQDITNVKKLEQIRTEFVSNVTHELKTPLTSIRGFIETLRGGAIDDKNVADKFLEIIDIEAERLYMLINDILQLSEIENKHKDSNVGTHNLKPVVEEIVSILQGVADKKEVSLSYDVSDNITVVVNRDRIKQMLINLIDNAIKYNVEGGSVNIRAYKFEGNVVITVKDTGIGIAPEHVSRIFERFYRVDKGRSRNMGGTGLGLSIVKHIVNLYSGDIKVNSESGHGTEFIVRLPV